MRKVMVMGALVVLTGCQAAENIPEAATPVTAPEPTPELTTTSTEAPTTTTEPVPEPTTLPPIPSPPRRVPTPVTPTTSQYLQPEATRSSSAVLASIRACESGGDYSINTGNGFYGAYQFTLSTWASVGGSGYPHLASPAEQDMRAQMMIDAGRRGEWPNC